MDTISEIYTPPGYDSSYPRLLRSLYALNGKLNKAGVAAPSEDSLRTTLRLYELIGRPLDLPHSSQEASSSPSPSSEHATSSGSGGICTLHVGGTNGKGTTAFKLSEACRRSGLRTGLFVSPHISCFRERMQVDGIMITEAEMLLLLPPLLRLCVTHGLFATQFELTFLLAAVFFQARQCQVAVLEVGLGGVSDATNVVRTALAVLTSVSLDHTRVLGATVEAIAEKKAGIFKRGTISLVGPNCPMHVVRAVASANGVDTVHEVETTLTSCGVTADSGEGKEEIKDEGVGEGEGDGDAGGSEVIYTDRLNARICLAALYLLQQQVHRLFPSPALVAGAVGGPVNFVGREAMQGLELRPPCRWQHFRYVPSSPAGTDAGTDAGAGAETGTVVDVILDVGHNPSAVAALMRRVRAEFVDRGRPVRILYGVSRDKDVRACVRALLTVVAPDRIHVAQSSNWRAVGTEELAAMFEELAGPGARPAAAPPASADASGSGSGSGSATRQVIRHVLQAAAAEGRGGVVMCCGTGYLMPEVQAELGVFAPSDADDLLREE